MNSQTKVCENQAQLSVRAKATKRMVLVATGSGRLVPFQAKHPTRWLSSPPAQVGPHQVRFNISIWSHQNILNLKNYKNKKKKLFSGLPSGQIINLIKPHPSLPHFDNDSQWLLRPAAVQRHHCHRLPRGPRQLLWVCPTLATWQKIEKKTWAGRVTILFLQIVALSKNLYLESRWIWKKHQQLTNPPNLEGSECMKIYNIFTL